MARDAFNADLETREQYLSLVYIKIPGEAAWTLIDQGKVVSPEVTAEEKSYRRIGDQNVTKVGGTVETNLTVQIYVEDAFDEIAYFLGYAHPPGGWVGTEVIQLDPTRVVDVKIVNFDGITTAANVTSTEYVNRFRPLRLSPNLDADGDARVADISGACYSYYIVPTAAL